MRRCVIIGGADIGNYETVKGYLEPDDFVICCDSGLKHRARLGIIPDLIIGDFDSHENPHLPIETIVLPCEKDYTDTFTAVREAVSRGYNEFLLLGVFGGRMDHALENIYSLVYLDNRGKKALAVDDYSEFEIVSRSAAYIEDRYPFFSLVNIVGEAKGITIKNAKYPLENAEITTENQYGISNEPLPGKTAEVTVSSGSLLLIRDR